MQLVRKNISNDRYINTEKMKKLLIIFYFSCLCCALSATPTTEGTEFWTTFLKNHLNEDGSPTMKLTLIVSSRENATVTVLNPQTGWSQSLYVSANQIKELEKNE